MAVANGYGKVATSGSVFMYDTGDNFNSYKGQPGTNITTGVGRNYNGYNKITYDGGMFFETNGYTEVVNIPALGPTTVQSVEINNAYCGYGCNGNYQCCPTLFTYTGGWMSPIWTPGQTYSYQIIYKCASGYTHPNFMYHYEYNSSEGYLTEYGLFDANKQESLGDGWYHAWNTFTVQPTAAKGYTGLWYYNYNVADKVSIAAVSISPGNTIRPPREIIPSGTTRSATQGLLPIVGNSTIDLSNMSYDSNAQMTFDGTDDVIPLSPSIIPSNEITVEFICTNTNPGANTSIIAGGAGQQDFNIHLPWGDTNVYWDFGRPFNRIYKATTLAERTGVHHWVFTKNPSTGIMNIYLDGALWHTGTGLTSTTPSLTQVSLGAYNSGGGPGLYYTGTIPIAKIYTREISPSEVTQNYNKYKTRFNLP